MLHDFDIFSECMRKVENGNLDVEIPRLEQVEINAVAMEYNRMLGKVKQLMEINIHREVMVKEAQLRSLEKQINSHFLYNVLDSIKMMAEVKGFTTYPMHFWHWQECSAIICGLTATALHCRKKFLIWKAI